MVGLFMVGEKLLVHQAQMLYTAKVKLLAADATESNAAQTFLIWWRSSAAATTTSELS